MQICDNQRIRWVSLVASLILSLSCGVVYTFALFAPIFKSKEVFGWNQTHVQVVGTLGNVGGYFGLVAGFFYDRYGAKKTASVGLFLTVTGWSLLYLAITKRIKSSLASVSFYYWLASQSLPWLDTSIIVTNIYNFPKHRGYVIALLKALNGLGASLFAQLFSSFFLPPTESSNIDISSTEHFLLTIPIICGIVIIVAIIFMQKVSEMERLGQVSMRSFIYGFGIVGLMLVLTTSSTIFENMGWGSGIRTKKILSCMTFGAVLLFLGIPFIQKNVVNENTETVEKSTVVEPQHQRGRRISQPLLADSAYSSSISDTIDIRDATKPVHCSSLNSVNSDVTPERVQSFTLREDFTFLEAMKSCNFWLFFLIVFSGTGAGLTVINNLAQIGQALKGRYDSKCVSFLVTIVSVSNCAGRALTGPISEMYRETLPRTLFFVVSTVLNTIGCICLAFNTSYTALCPIMVVIGFAYGMLWALLPTIASDLFGQTNLGAIYSFLQFGPMLGSIVFSVLLFSRIYDNHSHIDAEEILSCHGNICYRLSMIIISCVGLIASVGSIILYKKTRTLYSFIEKVNNIPV